MANVTRGDKVVTGNLYVGGEILNAALTAAIAAVLPAYDALTYEGAISSLATFPAANKGNLYKITAAGSIGGTGPTVAVGDIAICNTDSTSAGTYAEVGDKWDIIPATNIDNLDDLISATAENDFIVAGADPFTWAKKTLAETRAILGFDGSQVLQLAEKTPVNAVAANQTITFTGNALNNESVTIGGETYTFQTAIDADGVEAYGDLTLSGNAAEDETVTIGSRTYRWRNAIAAVSATKNLVFSDVGANTETVTVDTTVYTFVNALTEAKAVGTLTATANPQDGARVVIGSTTYTYRDTLVDAYDVLIGASASDSLDNLIAAINGAAGEGSTYGTGTVAHTTVDAAAGVGDTMDVTAKSVGAAGNIISSVEYSPGLSWGAGTLSGGVDAVVNEILVAGTAEGCIDNLVAGATGGAGEGTSYSTGTTAHSTVTVAKENATTVSATAKTAGSAGNSIAIAETCGNAAWDGGAVALSGGYDAAVANDVIVGADAEGSIDNLVAAVNNAAGEGTTYATGTAVHADVTGSKEAADTFRATAKVAGEAGNDIASTETMGSASWGSTTLANGEDSEAAYDVLIGATAEDSIDNLVAAINAAAGAGTTYGNGTAANASATAAKSDTDKVVITAKTKGVVGNSIAISEDLSNAAWADAAVVMSGGIDGTVGVANETCFDGSYLYHCIAANTIADANWRRISLGTAY